MEQPELTFKAPASKPASSEPTAFRLDPDDLAELKARAARLGVSHHQLARYYVEIGLHGSDEPLRKTMAAWQASVQLLRRDLAMAVESLLISAGKATAEQARAYVDANFR